MATCFSRLPPLPESAEQRTALPRFNNPACAKAGATSRIRPWDRAAAAASAVRRLAKGYLSSGTTGGGVGWAMGEKGWRLTRRALASISVQDSWKQVWRADWTSDCWRNARSRKPAPTASLWPGPAYQAGRATLVSCSASSPRTFRWRIRDRAAARTCSSDPLPKTSKRRRLQTTRFSFCTG